MPVSFTACGPDSWWCRIAYGFTGSGGITGFFVLIFFTSVFYASTAPTRKEKVLVFFKSVLAFAAFFGVLAFLNENYTKHILKAQRPSHLYILKQTGQGHRIDSLYTLGDPERQKYFRDLVTENAPKFREIDPLITAHWLDESGYSFPSGHTFNAFMFAVIVAYAIRFNRSRPRLRNLYTLPFLWAFAVGVSRVALGAHTPLDVTAGAGFGILCGALFLKIDLTRYWLTRKPRA